MKRHYYISDSLDDLAEVERELRQRDIDLSQIHVFGPDSAQPEIDQRALHDVSSLGRSDVIRSGLRGLMLGAVAAMALLCIAYIGGWHQSEVGWLPIVFVAIVLFGFFGWEGGLRGIQEPNGELSRFDDAIAGGKLVFYVDTEERQSAALQAVVDRHPALAYIGDGDSAPAWLIKGQTGLQRFIKAMP